MADTWSDSDSDFQPESSQSPDLVNKRRSIPTTQIANAGPGPPSSSQLERFEISSPIRYSTHLASSTAQVTNPPPGSKSPSSQVRTEIGLPFPIPPHLVDKPFATEPTYFTRPNRFLGAPATWRSWTEDDRAIATAIDRERATDLSGHLYNAHALKRKAKLNLSLIDGGGDNRGRARSRKGKERAESSSPNATLDGISPDVDTFKPPRVWTAWPLPSEDVPREVLLPSTDPYALRKAQDVRPSAELEECLISLTARFARLRWEARQWEDGLDNKASSSSPISEPGVDFDEREMQQRKAEGSADASMQDESTLEEPPQDDSTSGTTSPAEMNSPTSEIASQIVGGDPDIQPQFFSSQMFGLPSPSDVSSTGFKFGNLAYRGVDKSKPEFTVDDDKVRQLVMPSARHIISKLDDILIAAHRSRQSYAYGKDHSRSRSQSRSSARGDATTDMDVTDHDMEKRGRASTSRSPRKRQRGSKTGQTQDQDKANSTQHNTLNSRSAPLNPHDWSSIIGLASIVQAFEPETIARAAERCADLFGENMLFRTFHEAQSDIPCTDEPSGKANTAYKRGEGPWFQEDFIIDNEDGEIGEDGSDNNDNTVVWQRVSEACSRCRRGKLRCEPPADQTILDQQHRNQVSCDRCVRHDHICSNIEVAKVISSDFDHAAEFVCPFEYCERSSIPFQKRSNLKRHIKLGHAGETMTFASSRDISRKRSFSSMRDDSAPPDNEPFYCPVASCPKSAGGSGEPFKIGSRLYTHLRRHHPAVDVDMVKQLELQRRGERRGRWTDERRYRSRSHEGRSGSTKRLQRTIDSDNDENE